MSFPLYFILCPLAAFLIIYLIFILIDIYHLIMFSSASWVSFFMTFLFLAGVIYILFWTWNLSLSIDWRQTVSVFQSVSLTPDL